MALHSGKRKRLTVIAQDAAGHTITLENPALTDPLLALVPVEGEINAYFVKPAPEYDGTMGVQVPFVFTADGRAGDGEYPVAVDFGTETLFPGDAIAVTGTVGEEEEDV